MDLPAEPIIFSKAPNSLKGPTDDIVFPADAQWWGWDLRALAQPITSRDH